VGGTSSEHDHAFRELAGLLAAMGREAETRRALAAIRDPRVRRAALIDLPCRAAYGGDGPSALALALARGNLRSGSREEEKNSPFAHQANRTFACLVRTHRGEAAIAYARAVEDPKVRLSLLTSMPLGSGIPGEPALRRRVASLAYALVQARGLWGDDSVPYIAADFERSGDFAGVERVLARARGSKVRMDVLDRLLRVYAPDLGY
jgi:hypothetical protein